jgi:hypothetical protein
MSSGRCGSAAESKASQKTDIGLFRAITRFILGSPARTAAVLPIPRQSTKLANGMSYFGYMLLGGRMVPDA